MTLVAGLNSAQRQAVEHGSGPLLVLAGAGSGKTRVITHRIARLLEAGNRPESILAVSFTNKAAREMGERMNALVGAERAGELWLSTFHSFGVRFLREESRSLFPGGGRFVIFDQSDTVGLLRELLRQQRLGDRRLDAAAIAHRISLAKGRLEEQASVKDDADEYSLAAAEVFPAYQASLRAMRAVDFDDLVVRPVMILQKNEQVRLKWQTRFRHLLIDEFQDTNPSQLALVSLLANSMHNVCAVGDDDQSIYGWRGAEVRNILDFEQHFPGTRVVRLEDNYRSSPEILSVANAAIAQSAGRRHAKVLRAKGAAVGPVRLCRVPNVEAEAKLVASEIKKLAGSSRRFKDIAVLYRSNLQARPIEEELRAAQVPYRVFGGSAYFDRKEVKDGAAYLRVVINPRDELSLRRILNYPARGIGETSVEHLHAHAVVKKQPLYDALRSAADLPELPEGARRGAASLSRALEGARTALARGTTLVSMARTLFDDAGLIKELRSDDSPSGARRAGNLEHLLRSIDTYERSASRDCPSLDRFMQRIALSAEEDEVEPGNQVTLCTLHGAKGLEFQAVFLIGCVEGQLPHSRTAETKVTDAVAGDVEEERRLFYVGVTRARQTLYLVSPRERVIRGRTVELTPSRFLEGLPEAAMEEYKADVLTSPDPGEVARITEALLNRLSKS